MVTKSERLSYYHLTNSGETREQLITKELALLLISVIISIGVFHLHRYFPSLSKVGFILYGIPLYLIVRVESVINLFKHCAIIYLFWLIAMGEIIVVDLDRGHYLQIFLDGFFLIWSYFAGWLFLDSILHKERLMRKESQRLSNILEESNQGIRKFFTATIEALTSAVEAKDCYTKGHSQRVGCYALALGRHLSLSQEILRELFVAGVMHDVGKIGVPDLVLNKPTSLTVEEYDQIKEHCLISAKIVENMGHEFRGSVEMVKYHHERYDGMGYPHGISGEAISLGARIIAIADTFDAIMSPRVYRNRVVSTEQALAELAKVAGSQLDPQLVYTFTEVVQGESINLDFEECLQWITGKACGKS